MSAVIPSEQPAGFVQKSEQPFETGIVSPSRRDYLPASNLIDESAHAYNARRIYCGLIFYNPFFRKRHAHSDNQNIVRGFIYRPDCISGIGRVAEESVVLSRYNGSGIIPENFSGGEIKCRRIRT